MEASEQGGAEPSSTGSIAMAQGAPKQAAGKEVGTEVSDQIVVREALC